jgi:hypothetical protein
MYARPNGSEARRARDVLLDMLLSEEPKFPRTEEELLSCAALFGTSRAILSETRKLGRVLALR